MSEQKVYTEEQIEEAMDDYARRHAVDVRTVKIRRHDQDGATVGFVLSRDTADKRHGCDETFGIVE